MPSIKTNIAANLIGKTWAAFIGVILIPQYIKFLGIEAYGLVGFYGTLVGTMILLDLGLSTTINRELAKFKSSNGDVKAARDLTFSLEVIYWGVGILVSLLIVAFSWLIANYWVRAEHLPVNVVARSVMLMGAVVAFQWPISLYNGALTGLEKQVLNNAIMVVMTTLRAAGVILVLKYYSATVETFFIWQAAISFLYVVVMRIALWASMPVHEKRPVFSIPQIKSIWRFAAGMTGISLVTFFLTQIDKIVLSKILPLSQFGYYVLAFTMATSISMIAYPISISFFPRLTGLIAAGKKEELIDLYHKSCKLMAAFIFPASFVLLFFCKEILQVWQHNPTTTDNTYLMAQILIIGSTCNSLMVMPYNLLLAHGWTKFSFYQNTIAAIILVPMLFWWTNIYGALGATFVWMIVNAGYIFISQPLMHRKLLKHELWKWYWDDTIEPMAAPLVTAGIIKVSWRYFFPELQANIFLLLAIASVTLLASIFSIKGARTYIITILSMRLPR